MNGKEREPEDKDERKAPAPKRDQPAKGLERAVPSREGWEKR